MVLRVSVCQESPVRDLKVLIGKQVIVQRTALCQPGTFTYSLAYAGKPATVVSLKPSNVRPLPPGTLNRLPPATRALMEDQQRAATILVRFEDGTQLDSCAPIGPSTLSNYFELAPGQTLDVTTTLPTDPPSAPAPNLQPAAATVSTGAVAQQAPEPTYSDVFFALDSTAAKLIPLERQAATIQGKAKFLGYGGIKVSSQFKPAKSPVRLKSGVHLEFVVRSSIAALSTIDPATLYVLRTLTRKATNGS